jgi:2-aminoadipate transaminase
MIKMRYANRTLSMQPSIIRELLKIAQDPNVISFAGGMPSPASFPVQTIKNIIDNF